MRNPSGLTSSVKTLNSSTREFTAPTVIKHCYNFSLKCCLIEDSPSLRRPSFVGYFSDGLLSPSPHSTTTIKEEDFEQNAFNLQSHENIYICT